MGWEQRPNDRRYYTRSRRVNGRVVREYIGGGSLGELAAATDALQQAQRKRDTEAWRAEQARLGAADAILQQLCNLTDLLARAALVAAGYHQHDRGEWRYRRHVHDDESQAR